MNAIKFVKKFGVEHATGFFKWADKHRKIGDTRDLEISTSDGNISFIELKQIVEAFELVEKAGGISEAKNILGNVKPWSRGYNIISNTYFGGDIFSDEQEFYISDLLKAIELVGKCNASD